MKIGKVRAFAAILLAFLVVASLLTSSFIPISAQTAPPATVLWWQKPSAPDYAPSGVPDFDQKQDAWKDNYGRWSWCGPVALANCLWWWDSYIDGGKHNYSTIEDHFPLVKNYTPGIDDHDPRNVRPFISQLAWLADTDGMRTGGKQNGTYVHDLEEAIDLWLQATGLNESFYERTWDKCNYNWENVTQEFLKCEDVIFLLGFYQSVDGVHWNRVGGHYETVAGIGNDPAVPGGQPWVMFSDSCLDTAEGMGLGAPYVLPPGHGHPNGNAQHNDALYVSHDPYKVSLISGPRPENHFGIPDYPVEELYSYYGLVDNGEVDAPYNPRALATMTAVDAVVVFSPKQYDKPAYPDYAPSKMPDFDQKQDAWTDPYGRWSYCGPVALANSLWWFDSKYDPSNLVTAYPSVPDDHSPANVPPLINQLAWLADTDGQRTGIVHNGTYVSDLENATRWYLELKGLKNAFYERTWHCNFTFANIEYEVEKSEDVILLLGFYEWRIEFIPWPPPGYFLIWMERIGGHYVTVSGVNANGTIKFSDPALDWAVMTGQGEVLPPTHPPAGMYPSALHNNATYVSHDYYNVTSNVPFLLPDIHWGIESNYTAREGYPWWELYDIAPNGRGSTYQGGTVFVGVEYAVIVSPLPAVHDVAVANKITFSSKRGNVGGSPPPPLTPVTVAFETWTVGINVTVQNQGTSTETFTVQAFYGNATGNYTIGISPASYSVTLAPGASTTKTFTWDVPLPAWVWPYWTYTIYANVSVVAGETDTADNIRDGAIVTVRWVGDATGDGWVNIFDLTKLALSWKKAKTHPAYNPLCDFAKDDGEINVFDLTKLALQWRNGPRLPHPD